MKHIAGLLLLCLMIPAAPAAEPPHRASRNLDVPEPGWVRVLLDPATRGRMMPRANDLRVLDPVGREVPYALIESTAEKTDEGPPPDPVLESGPGAEPGSQDQHPLEADVDDADSLGVDAAEAGQGDRHRQAESRSEGAGRRQVLGAGD